MVNSYYYNGNEYIPKDANAGSTGFILASLASSAIMGTLPAFAKPFNKQLIKEHSQNHLYKDAFEKSLEVSGLDKKGVEIIPAQYLNDMSDLIVDIAHNYKIKPVEVKEKIEKLTDEIKDKNTQIAELENKITTAKFDSLISRAQDIEIKGTKGKLFISLAEDMPVNAVRIGVEMLLKRLGGEAVIVVCCKKPEGGAVVISKVSDNFVKAGISAGAIVSKITKLMNGNGGGKPNMAQGSAKDITNVIQILADLEKEIKENAK